MNHGLSKNSSLEKLAASGQVPSQPTKRLIGPLQSAPSPYCPATAPQTRREWPEYPEGLLGATSKGEQIPSNQLTCLLLGHAQLLLQVSVDAYAGECEQDLPGCTGRAGRSDAVVLKDEGGGVFWNPAGLAPCRDVNGVKPLRNRGSGAWKGILVNGGTEPALSPLNAMPAIEAMPRIEMRNVPSGWILNCDWSNSKSLIMVPTTPEGGW